MSGVWVFGYGSLVSPVSFGYTIGREFEPGVDFFEAEVADFGRRWNYGVMHTTAWWGDDGATEEWTVVALGVTPSPGESANGVVGWVADEELVALDRRERSYDRVDVTATATVLGAGELSGPIVTYVPRDEAVRHYEAARDRGRAAIEQRYWDLVDDAFAAFGDEQRRRYHATTPAPDVPVLPLRRDGGDHLRR